MWWIALIVLAFLLPEVISTVLDSRLARAAAARLESGGSGRDDGPVNDRIRYLEGEVDRLTDDVRRLREESDFLHRLLTERSSASDPGDRAD
jgi:hypothetical protein